MSLTGYVIRNWWLRHLLFWFTLLNLLAWAFGFKRFTVGEAYANALAFFPGGLILVYPLLYVLMPKLLIPRKFLLFFLSFVLLLVPVYFVSALIQHIESFKPVLNKGFNLKVGNNILPYVQIAGYAASLKLIKYFYFEEHRAMTAMREKTQAELELLKAQIHPHFLFNTLNNLFSHTARNSPDAPQIVLKLSDLLRFMIYESKTDLIPLDNEIELLKNYIDLEKLRYGPSLEVSYVFSGDTKEKKISPLLLLPLVEHCFKHYDHMVSEQKWISLVLHVNANILQCKLASSSYTESPDLLPELKTGAFELDNVRKRLQLLYPGTHVITVKNEEDFYLISVVLDLDGHGAGDLRSSMNKSIADDTKMPVGG
jgi:sensor histidine kinase YesM